MVNSTQGTGSGPFVWTPCTAIQGPPALSKNIPGLYPLRDFHLFGDLPAELQFKVWEMACEIEPVTIEVIITEETVQFIGKLPSPKDKTILFITRGSRGIGFEQIKVVSSDVFDRASPVGNQAAATGVFPVLPLPGAANGGPPPPGWVLNLVAAQNLGLPPGTPGLPDEPIPLPSHTRFIVNPKSEIFKLRVGNTHGKYKYPVVNISEESKVSATSRRPDADDALDTLQLLYVAPGDFPGPDSSLPEIFNAVTRISLKFQLPPWKDGSIFTYTTKAVVNYCDSILKSTIKKFPALQRVDLVMFSSMSDSDLPLVTKDWEEVQILDSDGVSWGKREIQAVDMELRMWAWDQERERSKDDPFPKITLKVEVADVAPSSGGTGLMDEEIDGLEPDLGTDSPTDSTADYDPESLSYSAPDSEMSDFSDFSDFEDEEYDDTPEVRTEFTASESFLGHLLEPL